MDERNDLTAEEARALATLASGPAPPASLEEATVARLAAERLIRSRPGGRGRTILATAAATLLFAAGLLVGERRAGPAAGASVGRQYVLLLYDAPVEASRGDAEEPARIAEYRDWARSLRNRGTSIRGEKLERGGRWLGPGATGERPLGGFFVFSAPDDAAALAVAKSCPHLKHGGSVEVRPIAKT